METHEPDMHSDHSAVKYVPNPFVYEEIGTTNPLFHTNRRLLEDSGTVETCSHCSTHIFPHFRCKDTRVAFSPILKQTHTHTHAPFHNQKWNRNYIVFDLFFFLSRLNFNFLLL